MRYPVFLLILVCVFNSHAEKSSLQKLDNVIRQHGQFEISKREKIRESRAEYEKATDDASRYNALRSLYETYRSFRLDSALIVAQKRLEIARSLGAHSKIASATINLAEGFTRTGAVDKAIYVLDTLQPSYLENYHLKYRNGVYREAYRTKLQNSVLPDEKEAILKKLQELTDTALKDSPGNTRGYYTLTAEKLCDAGLYKEAIATVKEAERRFDFSEDAAMLYTIGDIYVKAGDRKKGIDYMARSAKIDIEAGTKEYRSLITLTSLLMEEGDVNRAFEYINCAFDDAEFSHANIRTAEIMQIMPVIDKSFHQTQKEIVKRTRIFLILAGILVLALMILLAWYIKTLRENRRMMTIIEKINESLAEKYDALEEADSMKLRYINILMKANSEYISRLKSFRKNVYRCMQTGKYDDALALVKSHRFESADIYAFQSLFDEAFLSIFPDFIDEMNSYMKERINTPDPRKLTPELRVMAMMKLRMGSTEEISNLFHYSNQTVYNLRSNIRMMLNISWDEFVKIMEG